MEQKKSNMGNRRKGRTKVQRSISSGDVQHHHRTDNYRSLGKVNFNSGTNRSGTLKYVCQSRRTKTLSLWESLVYSGEKVGAPTLPGGYSIPGESGTPRLESATVLRTNVGPERIFSQLDSLIRVMSRTTTNAMEGITMWTQNHTANWLGSLDEAHREQRKKTSSASSKWSGKRKELVKRKKGRDPRQTVSKKKGQKTQGGTRSSRVVPNTPAPVKPEDLIGKRVQHLIEEFDGSSRWYYGIITGLKVRHGKYMYSLVYNGETETFSFPLLDDMEKDWLRIVPLDPAFLVGTITGHDADKGLSTIAYDFEDSDDDDDDDANNSNVFEEPVVADYQNGEPSQSAEIMINCIRDTASFCENPGGQETVIEGSEEEKSLSDARRLHLGLWGTRNRRVVIFSSLKGTTYKNPPKRKHRQPVLTHRESCFLVAFVTLHRDLQSSENEWPAMNTENVYWTKAMTTSTNTFFSDCNGANDYAASANKPREVSSPALSIASTVSEISIWSIKGRSYISDGKHAESGTAEGLQVTLFEELVLLKEFEKREDVLAEKVTNKAQEKIDMQNKVDKLQLLNKILFARLFEITNKIEMKKKEIEKMGEKDRALQAQFSVLLGDKNQWAEYLTKVYKKKIKRAKKKVSEDDESEESCDQTLYDNTCAMREKRLDIEEALVEEKKNNETLKKELESMNKKLKVIINALKTAQNDLEAFQLEKQQEVERVGRGCYTQTPPDTVYDKCCITTGLVTDISV
ncbi:CFAP44 [Mytilus edulis]|uniref:CFAP44 n=1 Tax=Mytilus edulis TaxID=6550 RepID=A0A8S3Q552_MYTED|nr:CFAP44 [Mytilus edulis]